MKLRFLPGLLLVLFSCKGKEETTQPLVQNITESVYASGIVKSMNQYQVFAAASGIIEQLYVTEGNLVNKGDAILTLVSDAPKLNTENARIAADYAAVQANMDKLRDLKINIDLARSKKQTDSLLLQRQRNLWAQEIGSRNELEQRELAYKSAVTAYQSALLNYNELKKQMTFSERQARKSLQISTVMTSDFTVRAKRDGKVYSVLKEPGEMVNTQTPVAVIGDANTFILELQVDEFDIAKIKKGQKVFVSMDSYKGQVFEAVVDKVDPIMNDRSRSFEVEAIFTRPVPDLYPNLTIEANILISAKEKALIIPRNYLVDENFVLLKNGEKRKVTVGLKDYERVEVLSGITKEDVIKKPLE